MQSRSVALTMVLTAALLSLSSQPSRQSQNSQSKFAPEIPRTWDDAAIATLEVPLANPIGSPRHVTADYYYKIPVQPIYKSYPVYAPGHEPSGYLDSLKQKDPEIVWDDAGHRPSLLTEADWIKAGEVVFEAPVRFSGGALQPQYLSDPAWYKATGTPIAKDGTVPFAVWVVRKKGSLEMGSVSCATCHTRVMPDGSIVKGAQGSLGSHDVAYDLRQPPPSGVDPARAAASRLLFFKSLYSVPWLTPDPASMLSGMSLQDLAAAEDTIPAGVFPRHRAGLLTPVQIPDLIGVRDRRYLDRTGLQQHRSIVDLMRYAAMNRGILDGADALASHDGFIPADRPRFSTLPDPATQSRYSEEQLYALALYVYSLQPPPNPNKFDGVVVRGEKVFEKSGCPMCHTPPLYTSNKLTLAPGFTPPPGAEERAITKSHRSKASGIAACSGIAAGAPHSKTGSIRAARATITFLPASSPTGRRLTR